MSYSFSTKSLERLRECHADIQRVMTEAIRTAPFDFTILCGHRNAEDQNKAFKEGNSKLKFPDSKHNIYPSRAIDVAPYPIDWDDIGRFKALAYHILLTAYLIDIDLDYGGFWKSFKDYPHFELK